jgi:hypothetical protein
MKTSPQLWALAALLAPSTAFAQSQPPTSAPSSSVAAAAPPLEGTPSTAPAPAAQPAPAPSASAAQPAVAPSAPPPSWFYRPKTALTFGPADREWTTQIYGFAEFDVMHDSTRAYADSIGSSLIPKDITWEGTHGRTQFTMRNTRLGIKVTGPRVGGFKPSAVIEVDFFANPGSYDGTSSGTSSAVGAAPAIPASNSLSETSFYANAVPRVRYAYVALDTEYVSIVGGQTNNLMGWQPYFFPAAMEFFGLPAMAFNRTLQLRLLHTFRSDPVDVDVALAALRPPQRDSEIPSGEAGVLAKVNHRKALHTLGSTATVADPLGIGLSGTVRRFAVDSYGVPPTSQTRDTGWGVSVDALVPIIAVEDADHRANALTLTGSFTVGSGDADVLGGVTTGIGNPPLLILPPATAAPVYNADIDSGLVAFTPDGTLHTIGWRTFMMGLQYYLPPTGRLFVSANFVQGDATNVLSLAQAVARQSLVITQTRYIDGNVFFDVTSGARVGLSYQLTSQTYGDGQQPRNQRYFAGLWYFF